MPSLARQVQAKVRRSIVRGLTVASVGPLKPVAGTAMRVLFNQVAGDWEAIRAAADYPDNYVAGLEWLDDLRGRAGEDAPPEFVLDVGCGTGIAAGLLVDRYPDASVLGIDIAEQMIERAERLVPSAAFAVGDANRLELADDSFDLATALDGMFSVDELVRVTRPGGWILIAYTNDGVPIRRPLERLAHDFEQHGAQTWIGREPGKYVFAQVP